MKRTITFLFIALVASSVPARASRDCMTISEARATFPGKWLYWHTPRHCWDDRGPTRAAAKKIRAPALPVLMPAKAPRLSMLWPAVIVIVEPPDAAMYRTEPITRWPLLLDVDELTANVADNDLPECCWPPLDEPPFRDRWSALPATWFFSALQMELQP